MLVKDPINPKQITVIGPNVDVIKLDLAEVLLRFSDFTVTIVERDSKLCTEQFTGCLGVARKSPEAYKAPTWTDIDTSKTELLVRANDKSKENSGFAKFAVIPAHLAMSSEQREDYAAAETNVKRLRRDVEETTTSTRYTLNNTNMEDKELRHPPLLSYRQWYKKTPGTCPAEEGCLMFKDVNECHHMYMNDIALLSVEDRKAFELQRTITKEYPNRREHIRAIRHFSSLEKMYTKEQKIIVGKAEGKLVEPPIPLRLEEKYGHHLCFIITSTDEEGKPHVLEKGDCGLIVYYKKEDGECLPMGMLVGTVIGTFAVPMYQAIILSQALKDIEFDYPHQVSDIRLLRLASQQQQ